MTFLEKLKSALHAVADGAVSAYHEHMLPVVHTLEHAAAAEAAALLPQLVAVAKSSVSAGKDHQEVFQDVLSAGKSALPALGESLAMTALSASIAHAETGK